MTHQNGNDPNRVQVNLKLFTTNSAYVSFMSLNTWDLQFLKALSCAAADCTQLQLHPQRETKVKRILRASCQTWDFSESLTEYPQAIYHITTRELRGGHRDIDV